MTHFLAVMVRFYRNIIICWKNSSMEQSKFTLVWLDESCLAFSSLLIWSHIQPFRRVNTELPGTIFLGVRVNNHVSSHKMKGLLHIIWEPVIVLSYFKESARNKTLKDELFLENNQWQHGVMWPDVKRSYRYLPKQSWLFSYNDMYYSCCTTMIWQDKQFYLLIVTFNVMRCSFIHSFIHL